MQTTLFAPAEPAAAFGILIILAFCSVPFIFKVWLAVNRPDAYRDHIRHEHERRQRNREVAGKVLGPVAGAAARLAFGALKRRF